MKKYKKGMLVNATCWNPTMEAMNDKRDFWFLDSYFCGKWLYHKMYY